MAHYTCMVDKRISRLPDFHQAPHPSRVYSGLSAGADSVVTVQDSSLPKDKQEPQPLLPDASRRVKDCCERFQWGESGSGALQLAIALLLDVSGDVDTALQWHEHFADTYVRRLPPAWTVPELDIALWLHCFENARPHAWVAAPSTPESPGQGVAMYPSSHGD